MRSLSACLILAALAAPAVAQQGNAPPPRGKLSLHAVIEESGDASATDGTPAETAAADA